MHTSKKRGNAYHMCDIQLTANHTLALENSLLNTLTCMVDLTCLQLDQTI